MHAMVPIELLLVVLTTPCIDSIEEADKDNNAKAKICPSQR